MEVFFVISLFFKYISCIDPNCKREEKYFVKIKLEKNSKDVTLIRLNEYPPLLGGTDAVRLLSDILKKKCKQKIMDEIKKIE